MIGSRCAIKESIEFFYNKISQLVQSKKWNELAKPEPENCRFCVCKHFCDYAVLNDDVFFIKKGVLIKIEHDNVMFLKSPSNEDFVVYGLKSFDIDNINDYFGKQIVFTNLTPAFDAVNSFKITSNTLVYENRW